MSEDFDNYTADASKQSDFEAMKKLSERWRAVKDNADKLKDEIKTINSEIAYLKIVNIKIFLLDHSFFL